MAGRRSNFALVDELGNLKAQKADLEKREREIKEDLIANLGPGAWEGYLFRATISKHEMSTLDRAAAREKLLAEGYHDFVKKHTKTCTVTTVRVVARNGRENSEAA
jgi:hypothetical protein